MRPEDLDAVMAIEKNSFPTPWTRTMFEEEIDRDFSDALVAVGTPGGAVIGYSVCWTVAGESHLLNIAVRPDRRDRGVGRALVRACLRNAAREGSRRIHLEVRIGNEEAQRLYRRMGFAFAGIRPRYYTDTGEDALLLDREITKEDAE